MFFSCIYISPAHRCESWLYNVAPPSAKMIPSASFAVRIRPSLIQPYVRIMIVLTFDATLNVSALIRPMIRNCERFRAAAANPDKKRAINVSFGTTLKSGTVSKNGTRKANNRTDIGA